MSENLLLNLAHQHVHEYADEAQTMRSRTQAIECRDCEELLQSGMSAFRVLRHADELLRDADYRGLAPLTPEVRGALDVLYAVWFGPCDEAEQWIGELQARGCTPANLDEFRGACEQARDVLDQLDWQGRAARARVLSQSSEPW